jgi:hypothetical protein
LKGKRTAHEKCVLGSALEANSALWFLCPPFQAVDKLNYLVFRGLGLVAVAVRSRSIANDASVTHAVELSYNECVCPGIQVVLYTLLFSISTANGKTLSTIACKLAAAARWRCCKLFLRFAI